MRHYSYRWNPGFTMQDFIDFLTAKGLERGAFLVGKYPEVVEPFLPKIEEKLRAKGLLAAEPVMETGGALTDAQAWGMLADLVPSALADQPAALRDALVAAFREEAARAA
jgi:hypothetical protein